MKEKRLGKGQFSRLPHCKDNFGFFSLCLNQKYSSLRLGQYDPPMSSEIIKSASAHPIHTKVIIASPNCLLSIFEKVYDRKRSS